MNYIDTAINVYKNAAENPQVGLCCTTTPIWQLPGLIIPKKMLEMNYGCGSTVNPRDLVNNPNILYVGVGGGMELLQFAYFSRKKSGVLGIDIVDKMLEVCDENLYEAEKLNPWFKREFVELRKGDALNLPIENESIDVAAQNCLFNIFKDEELALALKEMYRVMRKHGKLVMSDPTCEQEIPDNLKEDSQLRALCLSGSLPLQKYLNRITDVGFGTIEVRAKRPYRILDPKRYSCKEILFIESCEVCAIKDPIPKDGPCVFTGKTAIYFGDEELFDDQKGHTLIKDQPLAICDKTANALAKMQRDDLFISGSTYFYDGGGCC